MNSSLCKHTWCVGVGILMLTVLQFSAITSVKAAPDCYDSQKKSRAPVPALQEDPTAVPGPYYPTLQASLQTGAINTVFNTFGQIGTSFGRSDVCSSVQFEMPPGSGVEYLFGGALWVGGIVGTDTLVSVGADGWQNVIDLFPDGYTQLNSVGSITPIPPIGDSAYRSECSDTLHSGLVPPPDVITGRPFKPLPVKIATRAHLWTSSPADHTVLYDVVITNSGPQTISGGYAALFVDGDVGAFDDYTRNEDDVTGSLPDSGIAYIIDNNGDFGSLTPCPGALAARLLAHSWALNTTSYDWWVSNGIPSMDFGPMKIANYRNFQTSGTGTPEGSANKYFLMSHNEWDYDQVKTASVGISDTTWQAASLPLARRLSAGADTKFLLSFGPFNLPPDASVRFVLGLCGAEPVHTDSLNGRFIADSASYDPSAYESGLTLANISRMGTVAESLAQFLLDPAINVYGLKIVRQTDDSVAIEWDDWGFANIDGYNIYLSPIPDSAFPVPGVVPPWYKSTSPELIAQVGRQHRCTLTGLLPGQPYAINVAHRFGSQVGTLGSGLGFRFGAKIPSPVNRDTLTFFHQESGSLVRWHQPTGSGIDHFNIYKLGGTWGNELFPPFYTTIALSNPPTHTFDRNGQTWYYYEHPIYASVPGTDSTFLDTLAFDRDRYVIVAVDRHGFMSDFSRVSTTRESTRQKDILVLYNSGPGLNYLRLDLFKSFYDKLLAPYSYDLFNWYDSAASCSIVTGSLKCLDGGILMPYRLVIIDDGLYDGIMVDKYENYIHGFETYLASGGRIAYCGAFSHFGTPAFEYAGAGDYYPKSSPFIRNNFGIDSSYYTGPPSWSFPFGDYAKDSLRGFYKGQASSPAPHDVFYDAANPKLAYLRWDWPTALCVSTFHLTSAGRQIYTYRSLYPETSLLEGHPVGVRTETAKSVTYLYGFHIWSLDSVSAQVLIDWMMEETRGGHTAVNDDPPTPSVFTTQNYPNPFNPSTTIAYTIPARAHVSIEIFNVLGQVVRKLVDQDMAAGSHLVTWDGTTSSGREVSSGIYFYRLTAGTNVATRKMLLLK
ncbi:MAG: T9SS type A sorting domain-containing protein [Candidatus Zixiibacteriota bacterium]